MSLNKTNFLPMVYALLAAVLFGASAPLAKLLLGEVQPVLLAGLLYLGSGAGLLIYRLVQRLLRTRNAATDPLPQTVEAPLSRADLPWLAGAVLTGGVLAPVLLLTSLQSTPAATAALLLNFEAVATTLLAALAFHEPVGRRAWSAIALVTAASLILSFTPNGSWGFSVGALGVLGATSLWGLDNNLTRKISGRDPLTIVTIKGLVAGSTNLALALALLGNTLPPVIVILASTLLGFLSYGLSIVLFILAMRSLGAARTSALFGSAPFAGAILAVFILGEKPSLTFWLALPVMAGGALLLLTEKHGHVHQHLALNHTHRHRHDDDHHNHDHDENTAEHAHPHEHQPAQHAHPHTPDEHHWHAHE